jgi:cytosine/adenosine deaminase-related metal-dependent hydrolase
VSPEVEANMGHGPSATTRLRARGIPTGLSADVCTNVGGDLFGGMRVALALARGAGHAAALARGQTLAEVPLTAAETLAMATIEGARAIGLDGRIGSLEAGKQADLLVLRADAPGVAPVGDPVAAVVVAAGVRDVDAVMVGGRWIKRDGGFVARGAATSLTVSDPLPRRTSAPSQSPRCSTHRHGPACVARSGDRAVDPAIPDP